MWFQLWDSELTNTTDFVLGSKVAELPSTVHIKLPGLDGIEEQAAKEKEENEASSEALKAREGGASVAARATTKKFRLSIPQRPGPSRVLSPPSSSRASSFLADGTAASELGTTEGDLDTEGDGQGHGHEDTGKVTTKSHGHHKRSLPGQAASSSAHSTLPRKTVVVEECGGLQAVPVSDKSRQIGGPPADSGQHSRRDGSALVSRTPCFLCTYLAFNLAFQSLQLSFSFITRSWSFLPLVPQETARTQEQATAAATNLRFHTKSSFYLVLTQHTPIP